ncbi:MFS transporter [Pseudomonas oryzihabitans]|uniref:MFS transporter n=1 Tax=Pseudomonas oryzihabitans TaxID=47885 RepID=UPI00289449A7|nr:MFS transporter [Pseudomonas oryzihabitans]MDT3720313.1 MFS transporter [Pseudomonas oryzihabitans]
MTEQEYLIAWAVYAIAALLLLVVTFKATGWLWRWLREPIRLVAAVLLLTPTIADPEHSFYAPAIAVTVLDLVFKVGNSAWSAVADLSVAGALALVLYLVFVIVRWLYWRSRPQPAAVTATDPADDPLPEASAARRGAPAPVERREPRGRGERVEPRL